MLAASAPKPRKYLAADALIKRLRGRFESFADKRRAASVQHSLADCLMAAFAMFSLKDPSLLDFQRRLADGNLNNMYRTDSVPSDTQLREVLDPLNPAGLNECFADLFYELQRGGQLKPFVFADGHYLLAIDGTGTFSSTKICCPHCLVKTNRAGVTEYYHQMVAAVLVQQDGSNKNDCERNATRRLLRRVRQQHPKLRCIVVEDGLSSNAPHIEDLTELKFPFILGAKPGDHAYLFKNFQTAGSLGLGGRVQTAGVGKTLSTQTSWNDHLQLNASNPELEVGLFEHKEFAPDGSLAKRFSWIWSTTTVTASSICRACWRR